MIAQRSSSRRLNHYPQTPIDDVAAKSATFSTAMGLSSSLVSNQSSPSSDRSRRSLNGESTWISGNDLSVQGPSAQGGAMQIDTASEMHYAVAAHTEFGYQAAPPSAVESQASTSTMYGHTYNSAPYAQAMSRSASERARHSSQTPLVLPQDYPSTSMSMFSGAMNGEADMNPTHMHYQQEAEHRGSTTRVTSSPRELALVAENAQLQRRIRQLEAELNPTRQGYNGYSPSNSSIHMSPMLPMTQSPHINGGPPQAQPLTDEFRASWEARRQARVKRFCSLNRAGNSLCAWHDSRRERRQYPARHAPPGVLNCGCTYDQALFEESLSRHGVGSYHPGDSVRMDPALRNPLLQLLEERYGYRDGDFERDPRTGAWVEGEGHEKWEALLAAGPSKHQSRK